MDRLPRNFTAGFLCCSARESGGPSSRSLHLSFSQQQQNMVQAAGESESASAKLYLSQCSAAISSFLWDSIFRSLTMVNQALKTFFCSKWAQSFLTSFSRSLTY